MIKNGRENKALYADIVDALVKYYKAIGDDIEYADIEIEGLILIDNIINTELSDNR